MDFISDCVLTEWERDFFEKLSKHEGPLREWQHSQAKVVLRSITEGYVLDKKIKKTKPVVSSGPPKYKPKAKEENVSDANGAGSVEDRPERPTTSASTQRTGSTP